MTKSLQKTAPFLIIAAASLWGIIGLFSNGLSQAGFSAIDITFIRNIITAFCLFLFLLFFRRESMRIQIQDIWMFFGTGILSIVFFNIMYFITIQLSTLSIAAVLLYTAPFFVMLLSAILFHEQLTRKKIIALGIAFLGCLFVTGLIDAFVTGEGLTKISGLGILTGIGSGLGYALYTIFGNIALKKYKPETVTTYTFLIAAVSLAPFCVDTTFLQRIAQPSSLGNSMGISIISTLLPFCLYTLGLKYTEPGRASIMAYAEPVVATVVSVLILGQNISLTGIIGILLIFGSIVLLNLKRHSQ